MGGRWVGVEKEVYRYRMARRTVPNVARSSDNAACLGASWHNYSTVALNSVRHNCPDSGCIAQ